MSNVQLTLYRLHSVRTTSASRPSPLEPIVFVASYAITPPDGKQCWQEFFESEFLTAGEAVDHAWGCAMAAIDADISVRLR